MFRVFIHVFKTNAVALVLVQSVLALLGFDVNFFYVRLSRNVEGVTLLCRPITWLRHLLRKLFMTNRFSLNM